MRNKPVILALLLGLGVGQAQTLPQSNENSCASQWHWLFRERGAATVPDGLQRVVVSVRKYGLNHCLVGKIQVRNSHLVLPLYLEREDGSYFEMNKMIAPSPANRETDPLAVANGCSNRLLTTEHEEIELFFVQFLNPKPMAYKSAPSPTDY